MARGRFPFLLGLASGVAGLFVLIVMLAVFFASLSSVFLLADLFLYGVIAFLVLSFVHALFFFRAGCDEGLFFLLGYFFLAIISSVLYFLGSDSSMLFFLSVPVGILLFLVHDYLLLFGGRK